MQIYCPQCHTRYQIADDLVHQTFRKLRCSTCGKVFAISDGLSSLEEQDTPFDSLKAAMQDTLHDDVSADRVLSAEPASQVIQEAVAEKGSPDEKQEVRSVKEDASNDEKAALPEEKDTSDEQNDGHPEEKDSSSFSEDQEKAEEAPVDLEKIFERLSEHTEHLIETEKKLPFYAKAWLQIKNVVGFHFKISLFYLLSFCLFFVCVSLYNYRYDVVRRAPFMNSVFKTLGIKAKIPGEGLEFQNIGWEFTKEDEGTKLEIKGFIGNTTSKDIDLPTIHIEILDKETSLLQSQNKEMTENKVEASTRLPVDFVIHNPAPTAKYVYMTFIDKD